MTLADLTKLWERYLELTGDMEFLAVSSLFVFGAVILLVLLAKLAKAPREPSPLEIAAAALEAAPPAATTSAQPVSASIGMMGTGFDAKPIPAMTPKPAVVESPISQPVPAKPAPDLAATTRLTTPSSLDKTMVLPSSELPSVKPQPAVDLGMYEALVRRVANAEGEIKKDPLYLDPLMKRVGGLEKKIEELQPLLAKIEALEKKAAAAPAAGPAAEPAPLPADVVRQGDMAPIQSQLADITRRVDQLATAPAAAPAGQSLITQEEFAALKEKVSGLQKILELLAEGTNPPQ